MTGIRSKNLSRRNFSRLSMVALGGTLAGCSPTETNDTSHMTNINGKVSPGFERVKDAFAANFEKHGDLGAAFSLYHRGEMVVDLWGGVADEQSGRPWAEDSIALVFSSTKGQPRSAPIS